MRFDPDAVRVMVTDAGGIAHRATLLEAGASPSELRAAVDSNTVMRVRLRWFAVPSAPPTMLTAARCGARLACVTAAQHRGWWMPPDLAGTGIHIHVKPGSRSVPPTSRVTAHWTVPIVPVSERTIVESVVDSLEHVARCLPFEQAITIWESAIKKERLTRDEFTRIRWRSRAATFLAARITGLSDSGLETIFLVRMRPFGLDIRQQVVLAGRPVDFLVGERLVVQVDGFEFHSSSADRTRDVAHDRALMAQGYTVLRFSYAEVIYRWHVVEEAIVRAIAQGQHRVA